jgi:hypothetical protein
VLILLSGSVGCGKATFCQRSVRRAHEMGVPVAGVLMLRLWWKGRRSASRPLVDLRSKPDFSKAIQIRFVRGCGEGWRHVARKGEPRLSSNSSTR